MISRRDEVAHHLPAHKLDELVEVDGAIAVLVEVIHHLLDLGLLRLEAESGHCSPQLGNINSACRREKLGIERPQSEWCIQHAAV